jgi:hypothetical protein
MKRDYLKPSEAAELIPDCPFTANEIGTLLSLGLVKGFKRSKYTIVCISSLKELIEYRSKQ